MTSQLARFAKLLPLLSVLLLAGQSRAAVIEITNNIAAGTISNWVSSNVYLLKKVIYVETNATLIIEPGTVIKGATAGISGVLPTADVPNLVSGLIVTRGAKIFAEGTPAKPIIFTYDGDDVNDPNDVPLYTSGQWGGLVLLGRAQINSAANGAGNMATPKYDVYEGLNDNPFHRYGASDDNDSSGVVRYVSIRYSGNLLSANREFNGLSMGAIGRGTTVEYVEVFGSSDDGFEWWGGSANSKYLVAAFCEDDSFDYDQGFRGDQQFLFAIQKPSSGGIEEGRGLETDGDLNQANAGTGPVGNELPRTIWSAYNMTLIGPGLGSINTAVIARDESGPNIFNSVFTEWGGGIQIDNDGLYEFTTTGEGDFRNNLWNVSSLSFSNANANFLFSDAGRTNNTGDPLLTSVSRTNNFGLDPRPTAGSPVFENYRTPPGNGFYTPVRYRGAFGPYDRWIDRWTALYELGIVSLSTPMKMSTNVVEISANIAPGTTNVWRATNTYLLKKVIYVETNATLIIEPGTVIKGATAGISGVLPTTDVPNLVSGLIVTRGAKIFAEGTPAKPIIFTYDGDDVNDPNDVPLYTSGQWGGLVLLGRAQINSAANGAGNMATPKYDVYEGLNDNPFHRYGASDDNDSSGVVRYVSIRYSGNLLSANREFNGLSMGAIGRGTVVEYVEVIGSSDDGFEWWGGSANSKYLVAAFCEDDSFDYDQGFRGDQQFLFAIQKPSSGGIEEGRGLETDGDLNQANAGTGPVGNELPRTIWSAYNMTLIGPGLGSINTAVISRDESGPNIFNSVFTEWGGGIQIDNDGLYEFTTTGEGDFRNNLWNVSSLSFSNANANFLFSDAGRTNNTGDPLLTSVSRTNNFGLDPRPTAGSPAFMNVRTATNGFGFYQPTHYRGAFGFANWAEWTGLVQLGVFSTNGLCKKPADKYLLPTATLVTNVGGNFAFSFPTEDCVYYQLQATTNFPSNPTNTVWTEISRVKGTGGSLTFTDPNSTGSTNVVRKFYRVRVVLE